jgi:Tfp pilus assembly protein PilO
MKAQANTKQSKIFLEAFVIISIIAAVFVFMYWPQKRKADTLHDTIARLSKETIEIKSTADEGQSLQEVMSFLEKQLGYLEQRFPPREEHIIKDISRLANEFGIEIVSISPKEKKAVEGFQKIEGNVCFELPITLNINCDFKALIDYLQELSVNSTPLITINQVSIARATGIGRSGLQINLDLSAYLLTKE